jgi:type II secretory pathway pseudopilin PulG
MKQVHAETRRDGEQGFMLLGAIVLIFLMLLTLSIAAPKVARELRRDREVEAIHRGNEYVRAIQIYYRKFGHYPGNMDQLEKSNNIRFLRQKYEDPMTGKPDWRLIHVGEAKTTVKGFFGQPLAGFPGGGGTG